MRWVLFDWGDVLIRYRPLGFTRLAARLGSTADEVVKAVQEEGLFQDLLVGRADAKAMGHRLHQRFGVSLDRAQLGACFAEDVAEPMPGMSELVDDLCAREVPLGILSNTFFGHWDQLLADPAYRRFHHPMASHELFAKKPDRVIYGRALSELGAGAAEVIFFDDQPGHVEAARQCGLLAYRFESAEQARRVLVEQGLLS